MLSFVRASIGAPRRLPGLRALVSLLGLLGLTALLCSSCRTLPPAPDPVPPAASEALAEARAHLRSRAPDRDERAREAAERARELAPEWIAPRRLLDDLDREELLAVETLRRYRAELDAAPLDARLHYLVGRLQGRAGGEHFARALELDPRLAWAHHGVAWDAGLGGRYDRAIAREKAAIERARDPWERSYFVAALARFLLARGQAEEARALLQERIADEETFPEDRVVLGVQAVLLGLDRLDRAVRYSSYERGLELLREGGLTDDEVDRLVERMRQVGAGEDGGELELLGALASREDEPAYLRWMAEILLDRSPTPLALRLLERSFAERSLTAPSGPLLRAARFAATQFGPAVEAWLDDLPDVVLAEDGLPRDPRLRDVVLAARRLSEAPPSAEEGERPALAGAQPFGPPERLEELAEALTVAGWFREARSVAEWLAAADLDRALEHERRALAGQELLAGLRRLIYDLDLEPKRDVASASRRTTGAAPDAGRRAEDPAASGSVRVVRRIHDLDDLLEAMAPLFARANAVLGGETDEDELRDELRRSPRMAYGPVGSLIHPGPRFSAADQKAGRGTDGATVPGFAHAMDRLVRFALVGQVLGGGGPDAAVLTRLGTSVESGEHLGVPWKGTVVWCEGADVLGRASRAGARISGAALHEGYWVDVDAVREDVVAWDRLRRSFESGDRARDTARVERVLATRGLRVEGSEKAVRQQRRTTTALLGQSQRVRLAVLRDRAGEAGDDVLGRVTLDELVHVTEVHEQGHLTDRSRFLPLGRNLGGALSFLLQAGFSPRGVVEQLEYRAQLVALCSSRDPRIPLAQILDASEPGTGQVTAHGAAYRELLGDWLVELEREVHDDPERWPELDEEHTLVHQLHLLAPERVRDVSLALAKARGMKN